MSGTATRNTFERKKSTVMVRGARNGGAQPKGLYAGVCSSSKPKDTSVLISASE
jgi:hypothetical protein